MHQSILETLGSPLVQVTSPPGASVAAKIEAKNPGGSAKDRPALFMVEAAERDGRLEPGGHIVEPTSGNTGIGLAVIAAVKGYELTVVMPEEKSVERRQIMKAYGANIELTPGSEMEPAKERADELVAEEGMVQMRQFENPANVEAHYQTTAEEILDQIGDRTIDAFVAGVGTGGTITGVGRRLREVFPEIEIVAVQPESNQFLTGNPGVDDFQGMGPGFVSEIMELELVDRIESVGIDAAEAECQRLAQEEGIFVGQSSGASNIVAKQVAAEIANLSVDADGPEIPDRSRRLTDNWPPTSHDGPEYPLVVTVFWDSGERYMTTGLFDT